MTNSESVLHIHAELLPKEQDGMSVIVFCFPLICIGVRGHVCWILSQSSSACIKFPTMIDCVDNKRDTQPTVGELLLNNVIRILRRSPQTPLITSHRSNKSAISRLEFVIVPPDCCKI